MIPSIKFDPVLETKMGYSVQVSFSVIGHGWADTTWAEAEVISSQVPSSIGSHYNEDIKRLYALALKTLGDKLVDLYSLESFGRKGVQA